MVTESEAAATYTALRAAAAAAEATLNASARAKEPAAAEAVAAAARATAVEARVADAQAATAAMCTHACHAFFDSPHFNLLDARGSLRLVTDAVHEDDALCLALTCRALRDALWARFPRRPAGDAHVGVRVRTRDAAVVGTVGRFAWARGLDRPWPESPRGSCTPSLPAMSEERNGLKVGDQVSLVPNGPQDGCIKGKQVGKIAEISFDEVRLQSPTHGRACVHAHTMYRAWYDLHACAPGRRRTFQRGGQRQQGVVV